MGAAGDVEFRKTPSKCDLSVKFGGQFDRAPSSKTAKAADASEFDRESPSKCDLSVKFGRQFDSGPPPPVSAVRVALAAMAAAGLVSTDAQFTASGTPLL